MGILRQAVKGNLSKEVQRQIVVQDLLNLGVTEHKGKFVRDLDYYEAIRLLAAERAKRS